MVKLTENTALAPVCIFVYNRIGNTRKTVNALKKNVYAESTDVFVYSDGGRDEKSWQQVHEVRSYLKTVTGFRSLTVIERPENYYLERNIIEGVTETVGQFGAAIVLEDDVVTSRNFLSFMNKSLKFYEDVPRVMHISAFCLVDLKELGETVLWTYPEGSAWATWGDRWDKFKHFSTREEALCCLSDQEMRRLELDGDFKCLDSLDVRPIPWDICWYVSIVKNNGLCLTSTVSLVRNIGLYAGTHFSHNRLLGKSQFDVAISNLDIQVMVSEIANNLQAIERLKTFYSNGRFEYNLLGRLWKVMQHPKVLVLKVLSLLRSAG